MNQDQTRFVLQNICDNGRTFPHCDPKVLHAPGFCEYCDLNPDWQALRIVWGINFTGQNDVAMITCPAERERALAEINRWPGNTPSPYDLSGIRRWVREKLRR